MQEITVSDFEEYWAIKTKEFSITVLWETVPVWKIFPFCAFRSSNSRQDSSLVWVFSPGLQQALVCLTCCLWSSIISSQDWVGQTSGECALFDHKCDKNWQAGSLCTQVRHWLILLVPRREKSESCHMWSTWLRIQSWVSVLQLMATICRDLLFRGADFFIVVVFFFPLTKRIDRAVVALHLITEFCPWVNKCPQYRILVLLQQNRL